MAESTKEPPPEIRVILLEERNSEDIVYRLEKGIY